MADKTDAIVLRHKNEDFVVPEVLLENVRIHECHDLLYIVSLNHNLVSWKFQIYKYSIDTVPIYDMLPNRIYKTAIIIRNMKG